MSLKTRVEEDFKSALKSQDRFVMEVLRMIKAEVKNREIDKGAALGDDDVIAVVSSAIKKRRDSVELYAKGGRPELAEKEQKEIDFLSKYLPTQMSEDEVRAKVRAVVSSMGNPDIKQMGQVMKAVMAEVGKQAEGAVVSRLVKEVLSA